MVSFLYKAMTDQTFHILGFSTTFWAAGGLSIGLLLLGPRRLANLALCFLSLVITCWSLINYEAVYGGKLTNAQILFANSSLLFIIIPPVLYHFACLLIKQGWNQRVSILIVYILNLSFLGTIHVKNLFMGMGASDHFIIRFGMFDGLISVLYRIVFWATLGLSLLRAIEHHPKSIGLGRKKTQYFMAMFPLILFSFLGAPSFSELLFGLESKALAALGFPIVIAVMGYVVNFERIATIQSALPRIFLFSLFVFGFVTLSHFLTVSLFRETNQTLPELTHWTQITVSAIAFSVLFLIYHAIIALREKFAPVRTDSNQRLILEISSRVLSQPTLDDSIKLSLEYLMDQFKLEVGAFLLKDLRSEKFEPKFTRGIGPNVFKHFEFGKSLINLLTKKKKTLVISESQQTMLPSTFHQMTYAIRELPLEICMPLFYKKGALAGILLLGLKPNRSTFSDDDLNVLTVVGTVLAAALEHHNLSDQAMIDGLTHLYHQKYFKTRLDEQIRASNQAKTAMAVIMFDIDYFKKLNDSYGHQAGDRVLESVAGMLKEMVRSDDILARYGGEEFALFIQERSGKKGAKSREDESESLRPAAERLAEKIRNKIEHHAVIYDNHLFQVTVSVGIGFKEGNENDLSAQQLIERADQALYFSKQHGRNRVSIATQKGIVEQKPRAATPLETELRAKKLGKSDQDPI